MDNQKVTVPTLQNYASNNSFVLHLYIVIRKFPGIFKQTDMAVLAER